MVVWAIEHFWHLRSHHTVPKTRRAALEASRRARWTLERSKRAGEMPAGLASRIEMILMAILTIALCIAEILSN